MSSVSPNLPGPDAEPTQTPDQQTASGQPLGGQGSLLEALQSVGEGSGGGLAGGGAGIPQDAILSLLQGPSFGQRMGQALAGGAAAVKGIPNPANAIIEQQQRQQMGIFQVLERLQAHQDLQMYRQDQLAAGRDRLKLEQQKLADAETTRKETKAGSLFTLGMGIIKDPSSNADMLQFGQRAAQQGAQALYGMAVPDTIINRTLTDPEKKSVAEDLWRVAARNPDGSIVKDANGIVIPPEAMQILTRTYPRVPPDQWAGWQQSLARPEVVKSFGLPSETWAEEDRDKFQMEKAKLATAKNDAWASTNGFQPGSPDLRYANDAFRQLSGGRNIFDADPANPGDAQLIRQARVAGEQAAVKRSEQDYRMKAAITRENADINAIRAETRDLGREMRKPLSGSWIDMTTGTLLTPTQGEYNIGGGSKRYRQAGVTEVTNLTTLSSVEPMVNQINQLIDGLLVTTTPANLANALGGAVSKKLGTSPAWAQLNNLLTDQNVELARALGGTGQFRQGLMNALKDAGIKNQDTRATAHTIEDTIATTIQNRRQSIVGGGSQAYMKAYDNPLTQKAPAAGWVLKKGLWISEDGKWRLDPATNKPVPNQ